MLTFNQWLGESNERPRFIYTALKLDEMSHEKLKNELMSEIPEASTIDLTCVVTVIS